MLSPKHFTTERLVISPTVEEDAPFIFELMNTPKWLEFIGDRNINTEDDAQNYIRTKIATQFERLGFSNYTVKRKMDQKRIGSCGLYDREGLSGIDLGFAFLPEYEGKGYAFEAAQRILEAAFQDFGISRLSAITVQNNFASQKLLERLNFKVEGLIRLPHDDEELLHYSLTHHTIV